MLAMNPSLPPRPPSSHSHTLHHQPRSICRNFAYTGVCKEDHCPRAHVPYRDMIDLLAYLRQRYDCPRELRFAKLHLRPPSSVCRNPLPSDRICRHFYPLQCPLKTCTRTHLSVGKIYHSLLWPVDRAQPREPSMFPPVGPKPFLETPVDLTTCPKDQPVVELPQGAGPTKPIPFDDDPPFDVVVQPLNVSPPDGETTPTESVASEHPQPSPSVPSLDVAAHPLHPAGLSHAPSTGPPDVERPQEKANSPNQPLIVSQESPPIEPSLDSNPTSHENAVSGSPGLPTPATAPPSLKALEQPPRAHSRPPGRRRHVVTSPHPKNTVGRAKPPSGAARTEHKPPFKGSPAQANTVQVISRDNSIPPSIPPGPITAKPAQRVENISPNLKTEAHAVLATVPVTAVEQDPAVVAVRLGPSSSQPIEQHFSTSQRTTARVSPTLLHNPRLPQPSHSRGLHDQSSLPRHLHLPTDELDLSVMKGTKIIFSGGFSITKIITKLESLWFTVDNVPVTTQRDAIEHLVSPFGEVKNIRLRDENQNKIPTLRVEVQMATYREVVSAINGLDATEFPKFPGHRITVQLSLPRSFSQRMIRDTFVRVSWPVPCKIGYAGYNTLEAAQKAAQKATSKADDRKPRNYWITASVYDGIPILGAYNVRFMGLPADAGASFLNKYEPTEGTMLERPNYQAPDFGIPAVRRTLESFGKVTDFIQIPPPYKEGKVWVWCRFESPDVASAACELHRVKQRSLGMEKISVVRVLSVLERVPRAKFDLVEQDLHLLRQNLQNHIRGATLTVLSRGEEDGEPAIRLVAEDSKTLARLRVELSEILDGEILKENGQQVWDDFLRGEAGSRFLDDLRARNASVMISVHTFRKCVRLIGTAERRGQVAAAILSRLSSLRQDKVRSIPLGGRLIGVLFRPELLAAQQRYGAENIFPDMPNQVLRVRGPEAVYEEIQQLVHMVESRQAKPNVDHCPVCFDPPVTPVYTSCGHKWCKSCMVAYLSAAAERRTFPISCLGDQGKCTALIPIWLARTVLSTNFEPLAMAAFHAHVQARPNEYHYCPTPDCPEAYPTGPRNAVISCPSCLARICPSCHVEYHEGVTCADREDGGDRLFQEWMRNHDVKSCPGCAAPIERTEGCHHMTCTRCHTHICWVCLQTFPKGQGIYSHMRDFHGGIGL